MEWRPIETAPKDGRLILACNKSADEISGIYCAYWSDSWNYWMYATDKACVNVCYWMPLPEPPK